MPESEFGKPFDDLAQLIEGVALLADFNKAVYQAHLRVGFSNENAMELTKHTLEMMIGPFVKMQMPGV